MTFKPKGMRRERILVYGTFGTGKTRNWLDIALFHERSKTPGTFWVFDSDATVDAMLDGERYSSLAESERLRVVDVDEWSDIEPLRDVATGMDPSDWLVVDMGSHMWEMVQDHFVEIRSDQEVEDFYLMQDRKERSREMDWQVIKKVYRRRYADPIRKARGHVFVTASEKRVDPEADSTTPDQIRTYKGIGFMPAGDKDHAHGFHTVLRASRAGTNEWVLNSAKDREREPSVGRVINDFATDYLMKVGGWGLAS